MRQAEWVKRGVSPSKVDGSKHEGASHVDDLADGVLAGAEGADGAPARSRAPQYAFIS